MSWRTQFEKLFSRRERNSWTEIGSTEQPYEWDRFGIGEDSPVFGDSIHSSILEPTNAYFREREERQRTKDAADTEEAVKKWKKRYAEVTACSPKTAHVTSIFDTVTTGRLVVNVGTGAEASYPEPEGVVVHFKKNDLRNEFVIVIDDILRNKLINCLRDQSYLVDAHVFGGEVNQELVNKALGEAAALIAELTA